MKRLLLFISLLFIYALTEAQTAHPILSSFNAYKQPNGILLRWVIKGGNQCQGTKVFRSVEGDTYQQINQIPGICGSFTEDETYQFFDSVPVPNRYNSYRLELGFQGFSEPVTVFFEQFGADDHLVLSDPNSGTVQILFSNDLNRKATLRVFDSSGKLVREQTTTGNRMELNPTGLITGIYVFRISGVGAKDIHGKVHLGK